jgi:hypothetical protein
VLAREFLQLNVHRILGAVVRGDPTTGDARHAPLRNAILHIARTRDDAAHDALLVRAPFFQRIASYAHPYKSVTVGDLNLLKSGARELFDALRPSVELAIRSERIGNRYVYAGASEARMRELVGLIGRHPFSDRCELAHAVVGYMRNNTGLVGPLLQDRMFMPLRTGVTITATTTHVEVYGPLCFWNTHKVTTLASIFSHKSVRGRGLGMFRLDAYTVGDVTVALPALAQFSADLYWATQNVEDLSDAFANCNFNGRVGHLSTSRVYLTRGTFNNNPVFNQPLANWDVSSVENAREMFYDARSFNQPLNTWRFGNVRDARGMFRGAVSFNRPIGSWCVRNLREMDHMFSGALSFNQPLGTWDVASVQSAHRMFENTPSFNQPLDRWVMFRDLDADAMFHNSAFDYTMAFEYHVIRRRPEHARVEGWTSDWIQGRRMKPGRVVDAASLVSPLVALEDARPLVPEGWYAKNTETFDRGMNTRDAHRN